MKILMLVNWKVEYCETSPPMDKQPPDYKIKGEPYWFFRYFKKQTEVDVVDIHSWPWLEHFEKEKIRFYVFQTLKVLPQIRKYDLVISHGMQSGVVLSLIRRFIKTKTKHIVFDIGSFNSAAESGLALKFMQFSSKSIDGLIYHTEEQINYYHKFFPWIVSKSEYIPFGTDADFFQVNKTIATEEKKYILCVGYIKRDWRTLYQAFKKIEDKYDINLKMIGNIDESYNNPNVEMISYIPIKDLISEIKKALFCVIPLEYLNYSFGQMTLLQQMSLGKAIIAAKVPSMKGYIKDEETALFYEPQNSDDLVVKMERLINDSILREKLGQNAMFSVNQFFNEKVMAEKIEKFYIRVMEGSERK